MDHIQGASRDQLALFPESLDDSIAQENPMRFIDAQIDSLDFQNRSLRHAIIQETGCPIYHLGDLFKLYLYGYLNRIRSHDLASAGSPECFPMSGLRCP